MISTWRGVGLRDKLEKKMACDCKKDIEQKLLDRFKETNSEASNHSVHLQGYTLVLGDKLDLKGYMEIAAKARFPLKKGGDKEKTIKQNMVFTFCPFCGVKY